MIYKYNLPFVGCLFTFLTISFEAQIFLILMKSNLAAFSFVAYAFGIIFKKPLPNPMSQRFTLIFSSKSSIVMSLICFELIFYMVLQAFDPYLIFQTVRGVYYL